LTKAYDGVIKALSIFYQISDRILAMVKSWTLIHPS